MNSAVLCHADGINFALAQAKLKKRKAVAEDKNTRTVEFVIEKSRLPIKIGINLLIENCSKGEKNIKGL
jgi:hypothetical protein